MNNCFDKQIAVFGGAGDIASATEKAQARELASLSAREGFLLK